MIDNELGKNDKARVLLRKAKFYHDESYIGIAYGEQWWLLEQDLVTGAGLCSWYKTGCCWIGGRWCRTGSCWCKKVVAGSGLVAASAGLLVAGAGRWTLVQDW